MFQSRKPSVLFALALLIVSTALLSGCRFACTEAGGTCSGISPTYTPLPPTPPPTLSPLAPPAAVVQRFVQIYSDPDDDSMKGVYELFDSAYARVGSMPITCTLQSSRSSYGRFSSYSIDSTAISGTVALVRASMVASISTSKASFNLTNAAQQGWRIDSITGWIGGDITPQNPVGASQSCLTPAPATKLAASSLIIGGGLG